MAVNQGYAIALEAYDPTMIGIGTTSESTTPGARFPFKPQPAASPFVKFARDIVQFQYSGQFRAGLGQEIIVPINKASLHFLGEMWLEVDYTFTDAATSLLKRTTPMFELIDQIDFNISNSTVITMRGPGMAIECLRTAPSVDQYFQSTKLSRGDHYYSTNDVLEPGVTEYNRAGRAKAIIPLQFPFNKQPSQFLPLLSLASSTPVELVIRFSNGVKIDTLRNGDNDSMLFTSINECRIFGNVYQVTSAQARLFQQTTPSYLIDVPIMEKPVQFRRTTTTTETVTTTLNAKNALMSMIMWYIRSIDQNGLPTTIYYNSTSSRLPADSPTAEHMVCLQAQLVFNGINRNTYQLPGYYFSEIERSNIKFPFPGGNVGLPQLHVHCPALGANELAMPTNLVPLSALSSVDLRTVYPPIRDGADEADSRLYEQVIFTIFKAVFTVVDGGAALKYIVGSST